MDKLLHFFQFIIIIFLLTIFRIIGFKYSSILSGWLGRLVGPIFRSKSVINSNINRALPELTIKEKKKLVKKMWTNYGKILSDYAFLKNFRLTQCSTFSICVEDTTSIFPVGKANINTNKIFISYSSLQLS